MRYTVSNATIVNSATISDNVMIDATNITLTNTESGRIVGGVNFVQGGNILINQVGGIIRPVASADQFSSLIVTGSAGTDVVDNAGLLSGRVQLGDGADTYINRSGISYGVDLGNGDDTLRFDGQEGGSLVAEGGLGEDRVMIASTGNTARGSGLTGFEHLVIQSGGNIGDFSGYQTITLTGTSWVNFTGSDNPLVDLAIAGQSVSMNNGRLRSVIGSSGADFFEVGQQGVVLGNVALHDGNDRFTFGDWEGRRGAVNGTVNGGAGEDTLSLHWFHAGDRSYDFTRYTGFEKLSVNSSQVVGATQTRIIGASGFSDIDVGMQGSLTLGGSNVHDANVSVLAGTFTLEAGMTIRRFGFSEGPARDQRVDIAQGDDRLSTNVVNLATITGEVKFYTGDDMYDGSDGVVGGTVYGNAGNDTLIGGAQVEHFQGGFGADVLLGGGGADFLSGDAGLDELVGGDGADTLTGGAGVDLFKGTRAELAGDAIVDFERSEAIWVTDGDPATFSFIQSGNMLDFGNGQHLTVNGFSGRLKAQAASGGGIKLVSTDTVRGDINGDGRADILWRHDNGALTDWLGRADGGFTGNDTVAFRNIPTSIKVAGVADFNGDGRNDILWRSDSGALTNWLGQPDGGFVGNDAAAFHNIPTSWKVAGTGDIDGDGRADILWRHDNGALTDWLGRADGGFVGNDAATMFNGIPTNLKIAAVADFNGDGCDDILWRSDSGALTNWLGQPDGGFVGNDAAAFHNIPTSWKVAGTGDIDGDGRADILWRHDNGALTDWLGRADGGFVGNDAAAMFNGISTSLEIAGVADFNGDGRADILWRSDNGALTNWLGEPDGGFAGNDAVAFLYVPSSWHTELQGLALP